MNIKYPLAKETINEEDVNALCDWLKNYPRLTKGQLTWDDPDIGVDWMITNPMLSERDKNGNNFKEIKL